MIILGGITRITGSGLSIVEWNLISGIIPPLNNDEWNIAFEKYKQFPQYKKVNYGMTIDGFKYIFLWEYLHRFLGRLIGVVFIVPFLIFYFKGQFDSSLKRRLLFVFFLGGLQGFLGWFMVKSGLVDNPNVSHYRLAAHLFLALFLLSFLWVTILKVVDLPRIKVNGKIIKLSNFILALILIQILFGAFTAGLKAGYAYNTFPTMNGEWIPAGLLNLEPSWMNFFDNGITIQFIHRILGSLLVIGILCGLVNSKKNNPEISKYFYLLFFIVVIQFSLGVLTLLYHVPVTIAVLHQGVAVVLLLTSVYQNFKVKEK